MFNFKNNNLLAPSFIIGICILIFGCLLYSGISKFVSKGQTITVTGSAERLVISDTASWNMTVTHKSYGINALNDATANVNKQSQIISDFLKKNNIDVKVVSISASTANDICSLNSDGYESCALGVVGKSVQQNISVESDDVNKIAELSKQITGLSNVELSSNTVQYLYNNLKNIRQEMLSEATKNAKERADAVATAGGAKVSTIVSLSSGVFQVTSKNSIDISDYGTYDTSTIDKKITATVRADFGLR